MKNTIYVAYTMTFESPFHIGTGLPYGLVHRGIARDGAGYLYIPGSTIKGVLREKCELLASTLGVAFETEHLRLIESPHRENLRPFAKRQTIVERIFGSRFREGTLYFDNAVLPTRTPEGLGRDFFNDRTGSQTSTRRRFQHRQVEVRAGNCISRRRGTAIDRALFNSEYGIRSLTFQGEISGYIDGIPLEWQDFNYSVVLFAASLRLFHCIGASKSTGMGMFDLNIPEEKISVDGTDRELNEIIRCLGELEYYGIALEEHA